MHPKNKHPADRLHYLSDGLKDGHVRAIAQRLASANNFIVPEDYNRYELADWTIRNYSRDQIAGAHHALIQQYQLTGGRAFVKGRNPGSKNKKHWYNEPTPAPAPEPQDYGPVPHIPPQAADPFADMGLSPLPDNASPAPALPQQTPSPELDLSLYALKTDVVVVAANLEVAMKDYCGTNFRRIENMVEAIKLNQPVRVVIEQPQHADVPAVLRDLGVQHHNLPELISMCNSRNHDGSRLNVWLHGPAGTGKTTAAKMVSEALTPGRFFSLPAMETGFQILGYRDGHGVYQTTLFRECWENGGTIIMDESDSYSPSAALAANGALANGVAAFPDKMIARHPDCIIIAGANTTGLGGTHDYSGRMKLDAAFMDRWCMLDWPIDDALEASLCDNPAWLEIVRHCRAQVIARQIKGCMVTPRATLYGTALLRGKLSLDRVMRSTIRKSMTDAQWDQVKPPRNLINDCELVRELFAA